MKITFYSWYKHFLLIELGASKYDIYIYVQKIRELSKWC